MENAIASYLRQLWDKNDWLYEGQHGFRTGYSCESQMITVCQKIVDCLDNGDRIDAFIVDFSMLSTHSSWSAALENCKLGRGF